MKMPPRWTFLVALAAMAGMIPTAAVADSPPAQVNYEAALRADSIATSDPCIIGFAGASVIDFIDDTLQDVVTWYFGLSDTCAGGQPALYTSTVGFDAIPESAFTVDRSLGAADLNVTLTGFDSTAQVYEPVTLSLQWSSPNGRATDLAVVTGTFTSPRLTLELSDSIVWNEWHQTDITPISISGLWFCQFRGRPGNHPGCIGQVR